MKNVVITTLAVMLLASSANAGGWDAWDKFWGTDLPATVKTILKTVNPTLFTVDVDVKVSK